MNAIATVTPLDTTVYTSGRIARNRLTGKYWVDGDGKFDCDDPLAATLLNVGQMATIMASYASVEEERIPTLLDRVSAALNSTGQVGWFMNGLNLRHARACRLILEPGVEVWLSEHVTDGDIEVNLRGSKGKGCKLIHSLAELASVLTEWKED